MQNSAKLDDRESQGNIHIRSLRPLKRISEEREVTFPQLAQFTDVSGVMRVAAR